MGWLWSSGSQDNRSADPAATASTNSTAQPDTISSNRAVPDTTQQNDASFPSNTSSSQAKKKPTKSRSHDEEAADAELQKLIDEINYAPSDYSPASKQRPVRTAASAKQQQQQQERSVLPTPSSDSPIDPVALLPTTMSCRAAFDQAYHCQLPGGQLANVYRYGSLRNCKELWSNFWFCMRTNRGYMSPEDRARRIQEHYWQRQHKYRHGPSSDDVWKTRTEMETQAFQGDWSELDQILKEQQEQQQRERNTSK